MTKTRKKMNRKSQVTQFYPEHIKELQSVLKTKNKAKVNLPLPRRGEAKGVTKKPETKTVNIPKYVGNLSELKKGDMLVFLSTSIFFQSVIRLLQSVFAQRKKGLEKGYNVFTHAGIIYDFDDKGNPLLAHVTEAPGKKGYVVESLDEMLKRNEGRAFYVARFKDKKVRDRVAQIAKDVKEQKKQPKWSKKAGAKVTIKPNLFFSKTKPAEAKIHLETICSQFVTDVLQVATKETPAYYPTELRSQSFPKTLYSYFASKPEFELLCHTGDESPYVLLRREINVELDKMREKKNKSATFQKQYNDTLEAFTNITKEIERKKEYDELQKSYHLLQKLLPVLKKNAGLGLRDNPSYKRIKEIAERKGLFQEHIQAFNKGLDKGFNNSLIQHPTSHVRRGRGRY